MERFIEAVRQYPCLWNTSSKENRNLDKKDAAWKSIIDDLKLDEIKDIKTAKSEWKKLRDNHRDSLKRMKSTSSGQAATNNNTWKYAELMEFLLPYMKNRARGTNLTTPPPPPESTNERSNASTDTNTQDLNDDDDTETRNVQNRNLENITENEVNTETRNDRKRRAETDIIDLLSEMEQNHKIRQETRDLKREMQNTQEKHAIDLFLESMAITIKTLPNYLQSHIKRKIFNIVSEAEEEMENYRLSITPDTQFSYRSAENYADRPSGHNECRLTEESEIESYVPRPRYGTNSGTGESGYASYGYRTAEDHNANTQQTQH